MAHTPQFWKNYIRSKSDTADYSYHNLDHFTISLSKKHDGAMYNMASYFEAGPAAEIIQEVIDYFTNRNKSFTLVSNSADPLELDHEFLLERGFDYIGSYIRMVAFAESLVEQTSSSNYEIRVLSDEELLSDDYIDIVQVCFPKYFPTKDAAANYMKTRVETYNRREGTSIVEFGAFDLDTGKLVGNASLMIKDDLPGLAEMAGSAVLPDHQRRGIYSAFLHRRARYALDHGITNVFIKADEETSAPIVRKFGFTEVEVLADYHFTIES